ncbi:MAG: hypothetical protein IJ790_00965 [Lachnospiraceae bacterium]|nr:hypothetical protein [Lachnospiraceae bacterium]
MDSKNYILLNDGTLAVSKAEWDADSKKLALNADGKPKPNGQTLRIYTSGDYEGGCDYAFACDGHWYLC